MYFVIRRWGGGVWGGILAAGLLTTDMLSLIEGRLVLLDAQLSFWATAALYVAQTWFDALNADADADDAAVAAAAAGDVAASAVAAARRMSIRERVLRAIGLGLVCANAFSVKMTGLATPAAIGFEALFAVFFLKRAAPFADSLIVLFVGAATYMWWFAVHYWNMINWTIQTGTRAAVDAALVAAL